MADDNHNNNANIFPGLDFNFAELQRALAAGDNAAITLGFLKFLRYQEKAEICYIYEAQHDFINRFFAMMFAAFSRPEYKIPEIYQEEFILYNVLISNLVRVTKFINTDAVLPAILEQPDNKIKLLTLLSHRNNITLDLETIFRNYPFEASLWWGNIISRARNSNDPLIFNNLKNWVSFAGLEKYLQLFAPSDKTTLQPVFLSYFQSTYFFPGADKPVRQAINRILQKENRAVSVPNYVPDFKKIAVVSTLFHKKHAVYRAIAPYLRALKGAYHLTLLHFAEEIPEIELDYELFDEIKIPAESERMTIQKSVEYIAAGNYGIIYYTDIGMSVSSTIFSNLRIAPIQITGSGHPVSSFGAEIDYFIGGLAVEKQEKARENYAEKLVLIPGLGMCAVKPDYPRARRLKEISAGMLHILCNWGGNKFYFPHLLLLKEIIKNSPQKLVLHFPGIHSDRFNFLPFEHELKELLTAENAEIRCYTNKNYADYMALIEAADFAIDSYPFGSYTRVIDMLICGKPLVAREGEQSYNRAAAAILRSLGLEELIAASDEDYIKISLRLINEPEYLRGLQEKILAADLDKLIFDTGDEKYFRKALDYLVANLGKLVPPLLVI